MVVGIVVGIVALWRDISLRNLPPPHLPRLYYQTIFTKDVVTLLEICGSSPFLTKKLPESWGISRTLSCRLVLYLVFIYLFFAIATLETAVSFQHSVQAGLVDFVESVSWYL